MVFPSPIEILLKGLPYIIGGKPLDFGEILGFVQSQPTQDGVVLDEKDVALLTLRNKKGAVIVCLGTRDTGKTELAYRLAEFLGKPTYAISPEQKPHPEFIERVGFEGVDKIPSKSTVIFDDLPVYASNRDYNEQMAKSIERIVPMVRHERMWHLIFCSQSASQADKYILDCDMAFLKPLGLLMSDVERPNIKRIYDTKVNPIFQGKPETWIQQHAYMMSRSFEGLVKIKKVT